MILDKCIQDNKKLLMTVLPKLQNVNAKVNQNVDDIWTSSIHKLESPDRHKDPTSHLLVDFFIMTSRSNGPSNGCAIVTSQYNDVKKPHGKPHVLNLAKGQLLCNPAKIL